MRQLPPFAALLALTACRSAPEEAPGPWRAEPWPAAEALFRGDPRWRGGDAAYAVPLGGEGEAARVLWLFGDSFVARGADAAALPTQRAGTAMVRNSIGLQRGQDPATARMEFAWRMRDGEPLDWLPRARSPGSATDDLWHWPLHGLVVGDAAIVFCARLATDPDPRGLGFRVVGYGAFRIGGVHRDIADWTCGPLQLPPPLPFDLPFVAGTAVVADAEHVHAFALREPGDHAVFLLRWPRRAFAAGDLRAPEWRDGDRWVAHAALQRPPRPVLAEGAPEFTVCRDPAGGFVLVQSLGFGPAPLAVRTAPQLHGPWSAPDVVLTPPQLQLDGVWTYAGKGLELADGSILATYASNAWNFAQLVRDERLYYPHCVRLRR